MRAVTVPAPRSRGRAVRAREDARLDGVLAGQPGILELSDGSALGEACDR